MAVSRMAGRWPSLTRDNLLQASALLLTLAFVAYILVARPNLQHLQSYGYFGVFLIMLISSGSVLLPTPGIASVAIAGAMWDPLLVGIAGTLGSTFGEITGYLAGYGGRSLTATRLKPTADRIKPWLEKYGLVGIAFLAAIPNPLFDAAGLAAGALGFPLWKFLLATLVGKAVKSLAFAYLGRAFLDLPFGF